MLVDLDAAARLAVAHGVLQRRVDPAGTNAVADGNEAFLAPARAYLVAQLVRLRIVGKHELGKLRHQHHVFRQLVPVAVDDGMDGVRADFGFQRHVDHQLGAGTAVIPDDRANSGGGCDLCGQVALVRRHGLKTHELEESRQVCAQNVLHVAHVVAVAALHGGQRLVEQVSDHRYFLWSVVTPLTEQRVIS